jgi:hypothetical protein
VYSFDICGFEEAVLHFEVCDEAVGKDLFICFSSLPVSCIREGLRVCELFDENCTAIPGSTLLIRTCTEEI